MAKQTKQPTPRTKVAPEPDKPDDVELQRREKQEQVARLWQGRLRKGIEKQKPWLEEGREMMKFVEGSQWNSEADKLLPDSQYSKTTANRMHALVTGILASTVYQRPTVTAKPIRKGEEWINKANVNTGYLRYCIRENRFEEHAYLATHDGVIYGAGFTEEDVDTDRDDISRSRWRSAEDVIVDPDANTLPESCGWIAVRFTMNVRTARRIFEAPELVADKDVENKHGSTGSSGKASNHMGGGSEDEQVTLYRVWAKGDNPDITIDDRDLRDKKDEKAEGEDPELSELDQYLRASGNRRYIISLNHSVPLDERPWPFVLDHDEFPVTIWKLHRVPGRLLPYSPLKPVKELQRQLNWALCFIITQMRRTSQRKYAVNKDAYDGDLKSELSKLTSLESEEFILTSGMLDQAIREIDLGSLSDAPLTGLQILQQQFDEISGFQELYGSMTRSRSAYEAKVRDERAQTNTSLMLQCTEAAMNQVLRKMLQIGFSVTSAETVAEILGPEEVGMVEDRMTGKPREVGVYWDEDRTPKQIRSEVDIVLEPGSTRKVNKDQAVSDIINFMDRALGLMGAFTNLGMRPSAESLLKYINWFLRKAADNLGWQDLEQALIPPEAVGVMEEPQSQSQSQPNVTIKEGDRNISVEDSRSVSLDEPNPSVSLSGLGAGSGSAR